MKSFKKILEFLTTASLESNLIGSSKKKEFKVKQKTFFINFKKPSVANNCLRPQSVPLSNLKNVKTIITLIT